MTETVTKYQCTTCGETFELRKACRSHTKGHRRKKAVRDNTKPDRTCHAGKSSWYSINPVIPVSWLWWRPLWTPEWDRYSEDRYV